MYKVSGKREHNARKSPKYCMLKTNSVTRRSLATVATTARCLAFSPRLYHAYATLARSGSIFRRSSAVIPKSHIPVRHPVWSRFSTNDRTLINAIAEPSPPDYSRTHTVNDHTSMTSMTQTQWQDHVSVPFEPRQSRSAPDICDSTPNEPR